MVHDGVLYDSVKSTCLGKIWFFSCVQIMLPTYQIAAFFDHPLEAIN